MARKNSFYGAIALLTSTLWFAQAQDTHIHFGLEATYEPFEFRDNNNELVGFDVDIANAICEELGKTCSFKEFPFDNLIDELNRASFDAIISAMDITPARSEQVLFSSPYFENSAQFIGWKAHITDTSTLRDKKIAVQAGTSLQNYLQRHFKTARIVTYATYPETVFELASGKVDAIFADDAVMKVYLRRDAENAKILNGAPRLNNIGDAIKDADFFGKLGIATTKENTTLNQDIESALKKMRIDGRYQRIYDKWFK